jgi:hypothetical protein
VLEVVRIEVLAVDDDQVLGAAGHHQLAVAQEAEVAGVMACQTDEANAAIARTRAWLLTQGITVTSAQAAGYWISPGDKHLALALLKQIEAR